MDKEKKLSEKFYEVLKHEGVVAIVSWAEGEAHVANTWNSYMVVTEDERILIPAYGLRKTQKNVNQNNRIKLTLGTRDVLGYKDYQGTGFLVDGTARYVESGQEYDMMKKKFSFLSRVLEVTVVKAKQTL
ncbi:putative pyridoxine 5'-phosphate oxidase superfamily flavin-nucleotide-binding protein [Dysgonomonas sp. PFB1-18]|uniref:pyridoxamine 5'-phosphate oxidase family protein n=1 Tax=unclassified Dysgonomonas TaxID=2630389 RepID=UPI002474AC03|nr:MULTISPECIES: pyridoxamine 5'-phosphate oxidase family protein [unclassified Dysgonomonas]MDH6307286.1 putative pyridoxine 5'-phosphate oxidase superfamily flavin-nucleotide-binding protein [Dysgonomonas sp. PF1-14]MDH6337204.1 putative pyridoxine 5'-phosphate oxidase superfamily flavin-nucleotide-binding protein [Dysgonomonas sp. PF1-16]MDH6379128.1 putative pyridoxine 5'-phosphate oxidase superfamily flavin-nucleotide-binding protein [Dysgonomonas sp. PFB1-18]MDH6396234.1 putative pyridoxi